MNIYFRLAAVAVTVVCCYSTTFAAAPTTAPADNAELAELCEQDQAARQGDSFMKDAERIHAFDRMRRLRVMRLLEDGAARTARDHFHAALVLQHGDDPLDHKLANELCKKAAELDPTMKEAKWLMAASWDRYLMFLGKPQWYGTQFKIVDGKYYLAEADLSRVSDEERRAAGTRTVDQIKEFLKKQNKTDQASLELPPEQDQGAGIWTPAKPVPKMPATTQGAVKDQP
jgi:hypothetical protein